MREIRPSGLEGGVRLIPHPYPYPMSRKTTWRQYKDAPHTSKPPTSLWTTRRGCPKYSAILYLHLLKTLLELLALGIFLGFGWLFFEQVPLGRFYSSRPSSRSHRQIVSE
jgi:hypothetical protein